MKMFTQPNLAAMHGTSLRCLTFSLPGNRQLGPALCMLMTLFYRELHGQYWFAIRLATTRTFFPGLIADRPANSYNILEPL